MRGRVASPPAAPWKAEEGRHAARRALARDGLYRGEFERDACGVGLLARIDAEPTRALVDMALAALRAVWHRGAVADDGKTGDGAGLRLSLPQELFRAFVEKTGHDHHGRDVAVGQLFLPRADLAAQDASRAIVEAEVLRAGFYLYGWRQVPVDPGVIGARAEAARPQIEQVLFTDAADRDRETVERDLYLVRRRIEQRILTAGVPGFYACSLSARDIVYKGMFLAEQIGDFYPDLVRPEFVSSFAIFHQRYSTNTFPEWRLAQPFRTLAHNGEINTLRGNVNWMRAHEERWDFSALGEEGNDARPVIQPGSSDSSALDHVFELLVRAGRDAPMAKTLLMPEAWSKRQGLIPQDWRDLYAYCTAMMEPWDGPAAIAACDGRWAVAGLDRNGLRPLRWALTRDGVVAVGSETGMCPLDPNTVIERGAVEAGRMIAVDLQEKRFYRSAEVMERLVAETAPADVLAHARALDADIAQDVETRRFSDAELTRRQTAAGFTLEDVELILRPMAEGGREAVGSMGDDTPLAVLSHFKRPMAHFFRQNFSQVTNPPIDPLREDRVMSLKTRLGFVGDVLNPDGPKRDAPTLEGPILTVGMADALAARFKDETVTLDATFAAAEADASGATLTAALDRLRTEAAAAVRQGLGHLVITDEGVGPDRAPIPVILAVGSLHRHLTDCGLRGFCALHARAAECLDPHYAAVLLGVGATTVTPYLAQDTIAAHVEQRGGDPRAVTEAVTRFAGALEAGLLKIMAKLGISVLSAYRGGCNFEALGLSRTLVAEHFLGVTSRLSGIGMAGLEEKALEIHSETWRDGVTILPTGGFYRQRRRGERHAFEAEIVAHLQQAVRDDDWEAFARFIAACDSASEHDAPLQLRDLMGISPVAAPKPLEAVENANAIRTRFLTQGMSLGALSPEAHEALNIAMNRIGARSVSGEGGEDPARYAPRADGDDANSAVKQVASGRFGVTAQYLNQCREIEIKIAQGAKPGEGGQLPGFKVDGYIARLRHATPGVTLISPPPHHDIYSIEDLAQLIYDLKQANPDARVGVKLVAGAGVGTIAAGVAKAQADTILISGHNGGTGASPQTSIKFAGLPWEMGLAEAHQTLTLNGLRGRVTLRVDGGLRTGRDVIIAAMLGAEEFGVGTMALVAMGCLVVRQCHSNTCPVGVCTQDPALRARFGGDPTHVVRLMTFLAEDVRRHLAALGVARLDDIIGRADLLEQVRRGAAHLDDLDLNPILVQAGPYGQPVARPAQPPRNPVADTLDAAMLEDAPGFFARGAKADLSYTVRNSHRAVGARASSAIVRRFGPDGAPEGRLTVRLRGSAGQSLGAFSARGLTLDVTGDANDYVGKGLSGATIIVRPPPGAGGQDAIIGNTALYGATAGRLFAAGRAGERFAVRNSGACAVVEGCGANGCEYMTGGEALILGPVGDNFAAGMTGGVAYVYDPHGQLAQAINPGSVSAAPLASDAWAERVLALLHAHAEATGSPRAAALAAEWASERAHITQVIPDERAADAHDPRTYFAPSPDDPSAAPRAAAE